MAEVTPLHGGDPVDLHPVVHAEDADVTVVAAVLGQVDAAHRRLRSRVAHRLGVTVTDLTALMVVAESAESTPKQLAAELGLTSGTVTAMVDRLVESGLVRRAPKAGDRRSILVELTAAGLETTQVVSGLYLGAVALAMESSPHVFNRHILDSLRSTADALDGTADGPADGASGRTSDAETRRGALSA